MRCLIIALVASLCAGCASVTRGWNEQIQFDSEPPGAEARTVIVSSIDPNSPADENNPEPIRTEPNNGPACTTPCTVQVRRNDKLIATFSKPGYITQTMEINTRVAAAGAAGFAGNVLVGGVIGMGVDAVSGATLEHYPNPAKAILQPEPPPKPTVPKRKRQNSPSSRPTS